MVQNEQNGIEIFPLIILKHRQIFPIPTRIQSTFQIVGAKSTIFTNFRLTFTDAEILNPLKSNES